MDACRICGGGSTLMLASITAITFTLLIPFYAIDCHPPRMSEKKGIAIGAPIANDWHETGATWGYSWGYYYPTMTLQGIQTFGMIEKPANVDDWMPDFSGSVWVMGFNEPEEIRQANVTPDSAAHLWRRIEDRYADKLLVSPSPVFMDNWLDIFREHYLVTFGQYPRLDAIAVHCYRSNSSDCIEWAERFIAKARAWGIGQVWVTEFAFWETSDLELFVAWMEAEPMIARYAYYISRDYDANWPMSLFDRNGIITRYGRAYRN